MTTQREMTEQEISLAAQALSKSIIYGDGRWPRGYGDAVTVASRAMIYVLAAYEHMGGIPRALSVETVEMMTNLMMQGLGAVEPQNKKG